MRRTKTQKVAVYPDGSRFTIRRDPLDRKAWEWKPGCSSSPLAAALENVRKAGGVVVTERVEVGRGSGLPVYDAAVGRLA